MYAVTFQAEELNLLPAIKNAQVLFNGDIDLNARKDGSWEIEAVWVATLTPPPQGIRYLHGMEKLSQSHPLHALIVAAVQAHDAVTHAVTDFVADELADADRAALADFQIQSRRDARMGVGVEAR